MEHIKKTVLRALTTGKTGNDVIIIPDTSVTYHFKIGLVQEAHDWGFFDVYFTGTTATESGGGGIVDGGGEDELIPIVPPTGVPTVTTGTLGTGTLVFKTIDDNVVNTDGGTLLQEYGVLYTNDSDYNTPTTLIYENSPDFVTKSSTFVTIVPTLPKTYLKKIFPDIGTIYFRAYAKNANGVGYGAIVTGLISGDDLTPV
jgi:hypothetical protein